MKTAKPITTGVIQPLPGIGDMIWLLPALKAIAASAPDGKLTLFTKASSLADKVLAAEPWVGDIVYLPTARGAGAVIPNFLKTWKALRQHRTARLYILHQSARYRLAAQWAGIRQILAYPEALAKSKDNGWKKSLAFLKQLEIPVANPHSELHAKPEAIAAAQKKFAQHTQPWFIISAGASELDRCWPVERFAECADALIESGYTVFLTGAPSESGRAASLQAMCRHQDKIVRAVGLPFDEFMGLLANAKAILGNDSGPINVAAAMGVPAFVLCGITVPGLHSPNLHLIEPDMPENASSNGMERISAAYVLKLIKKRLG